MSKRYPPAKWVLPQVVDPSTSTCWQVPVPDDPYHRAAFLGALAALGSAYKWQDDPAHTAKEVAKVWQRIADDLAQCPPTPKPTRIYEPEDIMPIRVDCDCNIFVLCCDGTEKQILTSQQVKDLIQGSTGSGQPQPQPNGGCQTYHLQTQNGAHALIPVPVSTGDTILLSNASGSTNDSTAGAGWNCPNGQVFFAGACVGSYSYDAGSLVPAAPLGELVVKIGSTWFAGGALITVPSGISNVQPVVGVNYVPTDTVQGTISFDAEVCNNTASDWCKLFDFTTSDYGWVTIPAVPGALYVPGEGWGSQLVGSFNNLNVQSPTFAATEITSIETFYYTNTGYGGGVDRFVSTNVWNNLYGSLDNGIGTFDTLITNDVTGVTQLFVVIASTDPSSPGLYRMPKMIVRGKGPNPFGASDC